MYEDALTPVGLTVTQFVILGEIRGRRSACPSVAALARTLSLGRLPLRRNLDALERAGLVRSASPGKGLRGGWRVALTAAGLVKFRQASLLWKHAQAQLDAALGEQLATDLRDTFALIASLDMVVSPKFQTVSL